MSRLLVSGVLFGVLASAAPLGYYSVNARPIVRIDHNKSRFADTKESVLYSFSGKPDGEFPQARLMRDSAGDLFGTTVRGGGLCNCGTIFKLTPRGSGFGEAVIYVSTTTGKFPVSRLFQDKSGNFFGSMERGGNSNYGVAFKMVSSPSGGYTTTFIHQFLGKPKDGSVPESALISDGTNLYGTTSAGGTLCHEGTVYKLSPSGSNYIESVIHNFCGTAQDGAAPSAPLIMDNAGALYGTTQNGGAHQRPTCKKGCGTVFKLTPSGGGFTEQTLYIFAGGNDGAHPVEGLLMDKAGALYGTTQDGGNACGGGEGCGTVFKLTPGSGGQYTESVIYRFASNYDGVQPTSNLVVDKSGVLYGTTTKSFGLNTCDCGTVFALAPSGSSYQETILHVFAGGVRDGSFPYAGLVIDDPDRILYGTTTSGGSSNDGTVFEINL